MKEIRIQKLLDSMKERNIDSVIISGDIDLFYYTGLFEYSMERLRILLVKSSGSCIYYANELFRENKGFTVITHKDGQEEQALREIAEELQSSSTVAVEGAFPSRFLLGLQSYAADTHFIWDDTVLSEPMMCKDEEEKELMRRSSHINDIVLEELISYIDADTTEIALSKYSQTLYDRMGANGSAGGAMVAFGANCADPHPQLRDVCPKKGDSILIDTGAPFQRYESDMTRTVFFQDVSKEMETIYNIVLEANLAGIDAVCAGKTAGEIDKASRDVIEKAGYGRWFYHRTGHGVGLHLHEAPYINQDSDTILKEGMIFSIEPGIYLPGKGGIRIEDLVLVDSHGAEVLNKLPKELKVIG